MAKPFGVQERTLQDKIRRDGRFVHIRDLRNGDERPNLFVVHERDHPENEWVLKMAPDTTDYHRISLDRELSVPVKFLKKHGRKPEYILPVFPLEPGIADLPSILVMKGMCSYHYFLKNFEEEFKEKRTWEVIHPLLIHLAKGVEELHSIDVYHRDLKPRNRIMVQNRSYPEGRVLTGDCGELSSHKNSTSAHGTSIWWALETHFGDKLEGHDFVYDEKTDLYQLGLEIWVSVLVDPILPWDDDKQKYYEFKSAGNGRKMQKAIANSEFIPGTPGSIVDLIQWLTQSDRNKRPDGPDRVVRALEDKPTPNQLPGRFEASYSNLNNLLEEGYKGEGEYGAAKITDIFAIRNELGILKGYSQQSGLKGNSDLQALMKEAEKAVKALKKRDKGRRDKAIDNLYEEKKNMSDSEFISQLNTYFVPEAIKILNLSTAWGYEPLDFDATLDDLIEGNTTYAREYRG